MWPSWLRRQIVALKIEGSNPFIHPIFFFYQILPSVSTLGCRQAVRHQTLTLAFVGSSPAIPAMSEQGVLCSDFIFSPDPLAQLAEQLPFKQWVWSSNLQRVTTSSRTAYRSRRLFYKSHLSRIPSLLLSKPNPLHWASVWFWLQT